MRGHWLKSAAIGAAMAAVGLPAHAQSADVPGDASSQARIAPGQSVTDELSPEGDLDWRRLSVRTGYRYRISLDSAADAATPLGDPYLVVYDSNGVELARNDDSPEGLNARVHYAPSASGDVFIEARAFLDSAAGAYTLSVEESVLPPDNAGNGADTQAVVTPGQPVAGAIEYGGDTDWFRLSTQANTRYAITLDAADGADGALDPVLVLHGADGAELSFNDDSGESLNSALTHVASEAGDVFIEARGFSEDSLGGYTLGVVASPIPPDEAGNDARTRARVRPGQPVSGELQHGGDVDWYRLDVRPNQRYTIALNSASDPEFALSDPYLRLLNSDGEEISVNDDSEDGLNSLLHYAASSRGHVFIEARGFMDDAVGAYQLSVEAAALPADDAGNGTDTRARLAIGESVSGSLGYEGDTDWYRVTLAQGQAYRFALNSAEGDNPLGDPMLRLRDADGAELLIDDDGGAGLNSYIEFVAPEAGNYFLEARGFMDYAQGGFVLSAAEGDTPADISTDASLSASGDYHEGMLAPAGDRDWYRIELEEGQSLRIALDAGLTGGVPDPYLVLYNSEGAEIAQDDDGGEGLNSWLEFTADAAGAYYIEARGFGEEAEGAYMLSVTPGEIPGDVDGAEWLLPNSEGRTSFISPGGDSDWFAVELVEGRPYRFWVTSAEPDPIADPLITLYDSNGQVVASDDDGGSGFNSYLNFVSVTGGSYFAAVSSFDGASGGRYSIRAADTDVPGHVGTDEYLDAAEADDRGGSIDIAGDLDVFRTDLEAGVTYVITLNGEGDRPLADPFLTVLSSSGEPVTSDDDSGAGLDARLEFTPQTTDGYFFQASGLGGSTGGYRISVTRQQ